MKIKLRLASALLAATLCGMLLSVLVPVHTTVYASPGNRYFVMGQERLTNGTLGVASVSPDRIVADKNVTVTTLGDFNVYMANGTTCVITSGTCTVVGSPVTLSAGLNVITTTNTGDFAVDITIGTAANWNDVNSWSAASGGDCTASVPTSADNAYFDTLSFTGSSQVLTVDAAANCLDMDWTGATNSPTLAFGTRYIYAYGSITLIAGMSATGTTGVLISRNSSGTVNITIPITIPSYSSYDGGGARSLQTTLTTTGIIYVYGGTLITNNNTINSGSAILMNGGGVAARTLTLGSSIVNCSGSWQADALGNIPTLTSNTSTINCSGSFLGGNLTTYNIVNLIGATSTITGSNTFAQLNLASGTTQTITFTDGTTQTVAAASLSGSAGHIHTLKGSSTAGWNITKSGGSYVSADYLNVSYSAALPSTKTWYGGLNSTNGTGNTGWIFTVPSAPTGVTATSGDYTDKVVIDWTQSSTALNYIIYRDAVNASGTLGDVATYNDTGADPPVITEGSSVASDGTYVDHVALSLSGTSIANGTDHTYKVIAVNPNGSSLDSTTDNGYIGHGMLTYQWQRSDADSNADYNTNLGTAATYDDYGGVIDFDGRYYRCILDATGAAQKISLADRGYKMFLLLAPTNLSVSSNGVLTWTPNGSATSTYIIRGTGNHPTSLTDGTTIYSGAGSTITDVNYNPDTATYYYSAWSYNLSHDVYSTDYATASAGGSSMLLIALIFLPLALMIGGYALRRPSLVFTSMAAWMGLLVYSYLNLEGWTNWIYVTLFWICLAMIIVAGIEGGTMLSKGEEAAEEEAKYTSAIDEAFKDMDENLEVKRKMRRGGF